MKDAMSLRRALVVLVGLLLAAAAYSAWLAWQTERDLRAADAAVGRLQDAVSNGDDAARDRAVSDLRRAAASAADRTDGWWWGVLTRVPLYGDDAAGIEALSASVDVVAKDAIAPLVDTVDRLSGVVGGGRIDVGRVQDLKEPVSRAAEAMTRATALVDSPDSRTFVSALRTRYDDYTEQLRDVTEDFRSAQAAVEVLPAMLGADGPRDYLFIFQNNAEVRSTGGLPGSWARLHVEDGRVALREQGSANDLNTSDPVTGLTAEETAVYDNLPALYFQNPGFIPDVPRAAALFRDFWLRKYPATEIDGVISLDPVAMSYLMAGTGPVNVGPLELTRDNLVDELLSGTYAQLPDPAQQDLRFQKIARTFLKAATTDLKSPAEFVRGFARAVTERRAVYAPFVAEDATKLTGTKILGELAGDDGSTPHVDIGVNDATGGKMSYYLRYGAKVSATSCTGGRQQLEGSMSLRQTISPSDAQKLPDYVTANDAYGIPAGSQLVLLRIYGPFGGSISDARIDGAPAEPEYGLSIDGRPVVTLGPLIESTDDVLVTWKMETGAGQLSDGATAVTPSIVPGTRDSAFESAC